MDFELRTDYWGDPQARNAFKDFMVEIHGLDFAAWEAGGYWDSAYTPFSFFKDGAVVANVCIYRLNAVVDGRATHLAQVSGVGTLPGMRRQGLNRRLTEIALEWAEGKQEGVFLFSDTQAIPFYRACGFQEQEEYLEVVDAPSVTGHGGAIRLDCGRKEILDRIYHRAKKRAPVSDRLGVLNERLVLFHVQYFHRDHVYEVPDLGCIVIFSRDSGRLKVYDILGERIPSFSELYPFISSEQDRVIEFHFHADKLGLVGLRKEMVQGNNCFVKGPFPVHDPVFPSTARA